MEGSEEAVLAGVCDDDWPKIRQVPYRRLWRDDVAPHSAATTGAMRASSRALRILMRCLLRSQVVVEVHDEAEDAGRVARVEDLLLEKGFGQVIVDRASSNEDSGGHQCHQDPPNGSPAAGGAVAVPCTAMVYAWRDDHHQTSCGQ